MGYMRLMRRALEDENASGTDTPPDNTGDPANQPSGDGTNNPEPSPPPANVVNTQKPNGDKEDELVFYGRITNFDDLKKATGSEHQEQYEIPHPKTDKNSAEGRSRVRKTTPKGQQPTFEFTTKAKLGDGSDFENNTPTNEQQLILFKHLSEYGMIKERFFFPVEGHEDLVWEVDVFFTANGGYQEWCKIDLEQKNGKISTIPAFPIELTDVITSQHGQRTEEEETKVRMLYDTVFRVPNPVVNKI